MLSACAPGEGADADAALRRAAENYLGAEVRNAALQLTFETPTQSHTNLKGKPKSATSNRTMNVDV